MTTRTSVLGDIGDYTAPPGSLGWSRYFVGQLKVARQRMEDDVGIVQALLRKLNQHQAWRPLGYLSLETLCQAEIEIEPVILNRILTASPTTKLGAIILAKQKAEQAPDLPTRKESPGGRGHKTSYNVTSFKGNSQSYLACRLKRDHPKIFDKLETYPSMRAAAIDAGIIKVPTALEQLQKAWKKTTSQERDQFLIWIKEVK